MIHLLAVMLLATTAQASRVDVEALETGYIMLARDLKDPAPCEMIRANAAGTAPLGGDHAKVWYTRSVCFNSLATATGDASWCVRVRRRYSLWYSGSYYTPSACRERVQSRDQFALQIAYAQEETLLRAFGCSEEDVVAASPRGAERRQMAGTVAMWLELYHKLVDGGEIRRHLRELPDLAHNGRRAALADDPGWPCHGRPQG